MDQVFEIKMLIIFVIPVKFPMKTHHFVACH